LPVDSKAYQSIVDFYYMEAELQDEKKNKEWLSLLTDDATVHMRQRATREAGKDNSIYPEGMNGYIEDDRRWLEVRVKREETEYAWSENPPSRTKHFVSNVRVEAGEKEGEFKVKSYVLLTAHRGDDLFYDTLTYLRRDTLRMVDGQIRIAKREIIPDQTRITMERITFFL
jgi:3-phenylpropionate/cinnamic acid dioxygenase small subunit